MLLPHVELNVSADDPELVRSLLTRLSRVTDIGVVESVAIPGVAVIRAYAGRFNYTIFNEKEGPTIYENIGPQAVRVWQRDIPAVEEEYFNALKYYFGEVEPNLERFAYLYTEAAWYVRRTQQGDLAPMLQRRAFLTPLNQIAVLHLKQSYAIDEGALDYVLELDGRVWRCFLAFRVTRSGERQLLSYEEPHSVENVGF